MKMQPVESSTITAIGHEGSTLEIHFKSGGRYQYDPVPAAVHAALIAAKSIGSYFHQHIRNNADYRTRRTDK